MHLEKFIIKNFRGIAELTLHFNKGLNVLIGENNAGKTAIIDALRICLSYGNQKRDIYVSYK
ncbi:DNA repair protein RecN [termite gut metagenome]|uniref:DNA repair protein RecN n=1 Tax=termite gut metagenome TaxID=433724 RepID=A0A5J4R4M9_9ZZZZ